MENRPTNIIDLYIRMHPSATAAARAVSEATGRGIDTSVLCKYRAGSRTIPTPTYSYILQTVLGEALSIAGLRARDQGQIDALADLLTAPCEKIPEVKKIA